jgi:hypothetical protein
MNAGLAGEVIAAQSDIQGGLASHLARPVWSIAQPSRLPGRLTPDDPTGQE